MKTLRAKVLIGVIFFSTAAVAQYDNEPVELTMPEERFELGVNISPAALLLMGGLPIHTRTGIYAKWMVKPYKQYRLGLNYEIEDRYDRELNEAPTMWTDSTITLLYNSRNNYRYDIHLGVEFFKPNVPFTMVYGFDAIVGFNHIENHTYTKELYEDPDYDYQLVPSPFKPETEDFAIVDYMYFGLDFSVGPKFNFSKNINIMLQWSPELLYERPIRESYSDITQRTTPPRSDLYFNMRGFEAYLQFRF
jgi:hypothetical protein